MVKGFSVYVHLKGLAIVLLKKSMKALILALRSAFEVNLPRWMSFQASMENQISIWPHPIHEYKFVRSAHAP